MGGLESARREDATKTTFTHAARAPKLPVPQARVAYELMTRCCGMLMATRLFPLWAIFIAIATEMA